MTIPTTDFDCHPLIDLRWIRHRCGSPAMTAVDCLAEQDRVGPNALFDTRYYRAAYGAEIPAGMTCLEHFCRQTREHPRNPNESFEVRQWHETLGGSLPDPARWRPALIAALGAEARFAFDEMERLRAGEVVVRDTVLGEAPREAQEVCVFAHHDPQDTVQPYVLDYLDVLREQGVRILFLTNSARLTEEAVGQLRGRVWRLVTTRNRAYDWGLYAIGVERLRGLRGSAILLANDSAVATMNDLSPLFRLARSGTAGITGAVDCWLHTWHLQSFFLHVSPETAQSRAWREFWAQYRPYRDKWFVINAHEFGFSRWMRRRGVALQAAWRYEDAIAHAPASPGSAWRREILAGRGTTNPTTELWDVMLERGFPFLKRFVFNHPLNAGNLGHMCNVVSRLARAGGRRAGPGEERPTEAEAASRPTQAQAAVDAPSIAVPAPAVASDPWMEALATASERRTEALAAASESRIEALATASGRRIGSMAKDRQAAPAGAADDGRRPGGALLGR
jgi:hypothetical protein